MKDDIIIGASDRYNWDVIKYWINSINKTGFDGKKILIAFNMDKDTVKKVTDAGFFVVGLNKDTEGNLTHKSPIPVHVERFFHIWDVLTKLQYERKYRYVITTDVKDVVFQHDPFKRMEELFWDNQTHSGASLHKLIASSESMKYRDEPWGNQNLLECFGPFFHEHYKDQEINNVGVLGGTVEHIRSLCLNIFQMSLNRPIPIVDQAVYNFLLWQKPWADITYFSNVQDGWAVQAGTTNDPSKIDQFKPHLLDKDLPQMDIFGNVVFSDSTYEYAIVHQWDRVPTWRNKIEERFG